MIIYKSVLMFKPDLAYIRQKNRQLDIALSGSPEFTFKSPTSTSWLIDFREESKVLGKYLPFNFILILNRSSNDVSIYPNQNMDSEIFLGNNRERTLLEQCNSILINGNFNANEIIVICRKGGL